MPVPKINLEKLLAYHQLGMEAAIKYLYGSKPKLDAVPSEILNSDCSGWVKYLLYHASFHLLTLPDGSVTIREWCEAQGLHKAHYKDAATLADPSRLFLCFIRQEDSPDKIGHVWILNNGWTAECHGGKGVDRRPWNYPTLLNEGYLWCWELPTQ